jgi:plastocyanin
MNKSLIIGILAVVVVGVGALIFMRQNDQAPASILSPTPNPAIPVMGSPGGVTPPANQPELNPSPVVAPEPAPPVAPSVQEFTVSGDNFSFSLKEIRVKKGDRVRILFKNLQGKHDLKLDEFSAGTKVLSAGQEEAVEFTADEAGSFEYYCSVGAHRQMGMKGTLIVQ